MKIRNILVIIAFLLAWGQLSAFQIVLQQDSLAPKKPDTVCFKYKFNIGDKLIFLAMSHDSITINYGKPLLRSRQEVIEITCDSIGKTGNFFLKQKLVAYKAFESSGSEKNVERTTSTWLNREIMYEVDSVGNRYSFRFDDSLKAGMCPGGAFNPYLLFPFKVDCKAIDESWNVSSMDILPENGNPLPLLRQSSLFRARKPIDTLGYFCKRIEYIKTAQGSYELPVDKKKITVNSIVNGYGTLDISDSLLIPVHMYSTSEEKLYLIFDDDNQQNGWHFINTDWVLKDYQKGNGAKLKQKPANNKKHLPTRLTKKSKKRR